LWDFRIKDVPETVWFNSTPLLLPDKVIVTSSTGQAIAVDRKSGGLVWRRCLGDPGKALSAPTTDGRLVFIGACDGLHAIDESSGKVIWSKQDIGRVWASPVISNNLIYLGDDDHCIYALHSETGQEAWRCVAGKRRFEYPVVVIPAQDKAEVQVIGLDRGGTLVALRYPPLTEEKLSPDTTKNVYSTSPHRLSSVRGMKESAAKSTVNEKTRGEVSFLPQDPKVTIVPQELDSSMSEEVSNLTLRELNERLRRLDDVQVETFCMLNFPEVYDKFGRGLRRDEKINLLLDHCRRNPVDSVRMAVQLQKEYG
jgi:hypothetical protein